MLYTFGNLAALGIVRCSINQSRSPLWFSVSYVALVAAVTNLFGLAADAKAIGIFVQEFLALAAYFSTHFFTAKSSLCFSAIQQSNL